MQNILQNFTNFLESDKPIYQAEETHISKKRLTKLERDKFSLDNHLKEVLIGNILGDVYMRRFSKESNTRIIFRQGANNSKYLFHLFDLFENFTLKRPSVTTIINKETNKSRDNISFSTLALPCFNEFYELFYLNGKKTVPKDIANYLTNVSLAYWIMDDGGFTGNGLKLYTNAFQIEELSLLIEALKTNFSLIATINKTSIANQYTLYFSKNQMPLIRNLVKNHMHPSMLYKLNTDES